MDILFLHGALASKQQFDSLLPLLPSEHNYHTLNFSGHGGSFFPSNGISFQAFVQDILSYLDSKKIVKINLFGYSMGGYAALLFAAKYPERVEKIMTLNVKFKWDLESTMKETAFLNPEKMMEKVPFFANNLMAMHGINLWKDMLHQTAQMMNTLTQNQPLTEDDYKSITHPCLLAIGEKDTTSSLSETIEVHDKIEEASLLVIPNVPHPFEKIPTARLVFEVREWFGL